MKREKDERHPSWACPPGLGTRYNSEKHRITITLDDGVSCYRCLLPASIDGVLLPSHTISTEWKALILKLITVVPSVPRPKFTHGSKNNLKQPHEISTLEARARARLLSRKAANFKCSVERAHDLMSTSSSKAQGDEPRFFHTFGPFTARLHNKTD